MKEASGKKKTNKPKNSQFAYLNTLERSRKLRIVQKDDKRDKYL